MDDHDGWGLVRGAPVRVPWHQQAPVGPSGRHAASSSSLKAVPAGDVEDSSIGELLTGASAGQHGGRHGPRGRCDPERISLLGGGGGGSVVGMGSSSAPPPPPGVTELAGIERSGDLGGTWRGRPPWAMRAAALVASVSMAASLALAGTLGGVGSRSPGVAVEVGRCKA